MALPGGGRLLSTTSGRLRARTAASGSLLLARVQVEPDGADERGHAAGVRLQRLGEGPEGLLGQLLVLLVAGLDPEADQVAGGQAVAAGLGPVVLVLAAHEQLLPVAGGVEEAA